jgi:ADP-dependent phosphofructokinase/glucokinase
MSLAMLKEVIKAYDPHKITSDEINGLTEMLKHDSFSELHEVIIKKIEEIEAVVKTRKKLTKRTHIQRGKVTKKRTSMPMTESDESKMMDEMMPILWFTYLVDKEFSKNFDKKKPKDDKPKDP